MKRLGIIIIVLSLLVGCSSNEISENSNKEPNQPQQEIAENSNEPIMDEEKDPDDLIEENNNKTTITFPSKDGLTITADTYVIDETSPFMILFHQAGWSRGEYLETALEFNNLGYNVMAVDLRAGSKINEVINETAQRATDENYPNTYTDAGLDVQASIEYVRDAFNSNDIYLLGSSYSAALVLVIAPEYQDVVKGVLSFSPYVGLEWNGNKLNENVKALTAPVFLTSSKAEKRYNESFMPNISSETVVLFAPDTYGHHGARSLWDEFDDSSSYWTAVIDFLEDLKEQ